MSHAASRIGIADHFGGAIGNDPFDGNHAVRWTVKIVPLATQTEIEGDDRVDRVGCDGHRQVGDVYLRGRGGEGENRTHGIGLGPGLVDTHHGTASATAVGVTQIGEQAYFRHV